MSAIELLFIQLDDTPLEINAREIEILFSVQEDGFLHFGVGSRFRYQNSEYKVRDLDVHFLDFNHDGNVSKFPTPSREGFYVQVVYKVQPILN